MGSDSLYLFPESAFDFINYGFPVLRKSRKTEKRTRDTPHSLTPGGLFFPILSRTMGFPRRFCCLHCCTVLHQGHSRMIKEAQNPGNTPHKSSFTFWPFLPIHLLLLVLSCLLYFVVISKRDGCSNLLYLGQQLKVTVDFAY